MAGAWLDNHKKMNNAEIEGLIALAKEGCVGIAALENEVKYRGDLTEDELLDYSNLGKEAVPGIPI